MGTAEVGGLTHVVAQDPKNSDLGTIELIFAPDPVRLTGWILTDDACNQTMIKLGAFDTSQSQTALLYSVQNELAKRNR